MTRAFSQLAEGGTVVGDYEWLDRVHLSLGYLPLARLPKGKLAMGEYCIERVKNLVPKSLRVNPVPKIYADFEVATNTVKGSNIENTSFAFSEIDIVKRAIDAAREYPKAEIILAVSPDFLLGKAALPDNVVSRFINSDAAYMKIRY
jgi:spore coat polysaccharide biosynthesis protein SpsF (cytidylyltransferase family)